MSEWQPMIDAPQDGTPIVAILRVYSNKRGEFLHWDRHIIWFNQEAGEIDADDYTGWSWDDYEFWHDLLPLPEIPASAPPRMMKPDTILEPESRK